MEDPQHRSAPVAQEQTENSDPPARRRVSRIVHDHKGNATVQWYDAPPGYQRQVFEIEGGGTGARAAPAGPRRSLETGSLAVSSEDTHNPYMRIPETERKRGPGGATDLRKLSAWIKMMRELEEAKKRNSGGE
jgi:hypothetical protein